MQHPQSFIGAIPVFRICFLPFRPYLSEEKILVEISSPLVYDSKSV